MNFRQLVLRNVTRNGRTYASYFLSSLFSVMVFFIFSLLFFHPDIKNGVVASSDTVSFFATTGVRIAQIVIVLMSLIFLWYTFGVFIKSRKRDFSMYLILGMSERDLRRMVFLENSLLGVVSILTGILIGLIFSKLILLMSQNMLALEQSLDFYLPIQPIILTAVVYSLLFFIISFVTTVNIQTENLTEMSKSADKPLTVPRTNWFLAVLSIVLIAGGYSFVLYFAFNARTALSLGLILLLICVLLTMAGTYFFFHQNSVRLFAFLTKRSLFLKGTNMLAISNLVFRMKMNATMYFMIAIVASVAFVGIGTTMSIGGQEFAQTQNQSFAYTYTSDFVSDEMTEGVHLKNIAFIEDRIKEAGFQPLTVKIMPLNLTILDQQSGRQWLTLIKESDYNTLARFNRQKEIHAESNRSLVMLARTNADVVENRKKAGQIFSMEAVLVEGQPSETLSYEFSSARFNFDYGQVALMSDEFYQALHQLKTTNPEEAASLSQTYIIDFPEWAEEGASNHKIINHLNTQIAAYEANVDAVFEKIGGVDGEKEYSDAENAEIDKATASWFSYSSLYDTWLETRQANGIILLISILLGSVFFSFAACIIYFRLFGELDQAGDYHRSLHILGVSRPDRHKVVTHEMLVMYFVPILLAMCHFAVAMYALGRITELPVWLYFMRIVLSYIVFQLIFFIVSRWRYLKHLDLRAENN